MLESGRNLPRLKPRGTLKTQSKESLQRDQQVNDEGKVRNKTCYLHGGYVVAFIENVPKKKRVGSVRANAQAH